MVFRKRMRGTAVKREARLMSAAWWLRLLANIFLVVGVLSLFAFGGLSYRSKHGEPPFDPTKLKTPEAISQYREDVASFKRRQIIAEEVGERFAIAALICVGIGSILNHAARSAPKQAPPTD